MKIHLAGIGGVGMAGLAVLLKRRGHVVDGCDVHAGPRTRWLESLGIPVAIGHDAQHLADADALIVTPAVAADNPELLAARARGAGFVRTRGRVLAQLVSEAEDSIAVCGSHGKTTTATFIAKLLLALGENVEWAIGGETGSFPVAGEGAVTQERDHPVCEPAPREGRAPARPPVLVVEADESDGTLAEYRARTLVVTNCEYDHPDHFKTRADYVACYDAARAKAQDVIEGESLAHTENQPSALHSHSQPSTFNLQPSTWFSSLAPHNRRNARMAIEVALRRGHKIEAILAAMADIVTQLPDRRFQRVWPLDADAGEVCGEGRAGDPRRETRAKTRDLRPETSRLAPPVPCPVVYTDYAHHPTEMACAVRMARAAAKDGRVIVLFQPHRYSRTKALKNEFPAAFAGADEVVLCPTYAAFEQPVEGGDIADLYAACRAAFASETYKGSDPLYVACAAADGQEPVSPGTAAPRLYLARTLAEAWEHARNTMKPGDLTLLLGAGDIIDLVPRIQSELSQLTYKGSDPLYVGRPFSGKGSDPMPERRIWIGQGSNTWKSDLKLDVEYVKTEGPAGRPGAALLADSAIGPRIPWMAGIPGTIGGWIKMNAGAFGHSISEVLEAVKVDGRWIPAADCGFGYRHSDIVGEIQDARFVGAAEEDVRRGTGDAGGETGDPKSYLARRKKFPAGTKGSVFKNPPGDFAGRLLEEAGAKSLRVGGAYVWSEHANVIVAGPDATASDFLALARLMAARVRFRSGVSLEPEVGGIAVG